MNLMTIIKFSGWKEMQPKLILKKPIENWLLNGILTKIQTTKSKQQKLLKLLVRPTQFFLIQAKGQPTINTVKRV